MVEAVCSPELISKEEALSRLLGEGGRTLLAYSGGVDSAYLAVLAHEALADRFLAVLADSPSLADFEREEALDFARERDLPLRVVATRELEQEDYRRNGPDRCFHCKAELFSLMGDLAGREGFETLLYGGNHSDRMDHRPGAEAARRFRVRAPLAEIGLEKEEIRALARRRGLSVWDKPARACLASRIPHFSEVTANKLQQLARAERCIRDLGFREYRVRHHDAVARLEIGAGEWDRFRDPDLRELLHRQLSALGFKIVALDLLAFESGRLSRLSRSADLTESDEIN